ncbi:polysaccharide biosynthesis protein [Flavobacterium sp. xlx-214]|uniref:oligosaccharide flippase family protein n=1 Tax=unclassified Flavobacterium TaxID=196869 RepID=UPI0013D684A8|nr:MULTISPECIES: oligosaccharide flippase family protein [unclassified Flavobacterium]MBA5792157.1 polysaccharide biosynthesis protein [Flavobacterium sp. xlx-221]QMI84402.1 polysaccharide biosynthesis protein [Flavobacterium sp. xlx-214]
MSVYKNLFKTTLIYGIATVIPKMIGFFMTPYHTDWLPIGAYKDYTLIFSWMMFFNVVLSFGMETAFFRFYNKQENKKEVINNTLWFLMAVCVVFLGLIYVFKHAVDTYFGIPPIVVSFLIWILVLDTLTVIPFAILRAQQRPIKYSIIKIANVVINAGLTVLFLYVIPTYLQKNPSSSLSSYFNPDFQVGYLFISNLIASIVTLLFLSKYYVQLKATFNKVLWKEMIIYSFPVMIGGLAFVVNETFDKVFLDILLPQDFKELGLASYGAIYKIGVFMVLFRMAYSLGIEPFFFSYAKNDDAPIKYATITKYFIIFGSFAMLSIVVFADFIKTFYVPKQEYWFAMEIVPYIILANLMLGIYTNLSVWYKLQDKTKIGAYISVFGAIVTLILNYILIPKIGLIGSAITTLIAYGVMMLISFVLGQKSYPIPYDKKAISMYLGTAILFSFGYFYNFRENYFVGIALILIFVGLIYYNEKVMIQRIIKSVIKK